MSHPRVHLHGGGHGHGPGDAPAQGAEGPLEVKLKPAPKRDVLPDRRLSFAPEVWRKLFLFTTLCPVEISGLGMVEPDGPTGEDFKVTELFMVTQDVTDIQTRMDQEEVSLLVSRLVDEGRDPANLRLWWHSHAREEVFWSGEDEETIEHFANDWMISLETNHRMRTLSRLDHYAVRSTTWVWVDRPAEPVQATDEEILAVRSEIAGLIRRGPFAAPRGRG
jgi:hypothetical protein